MSGAAIVALLAASWYATEVRVDGQPVDGPAWAAMMFGRRLHLTLTRSDYNTVLGEIHGGTA